MFINLTTHYSLYLNTFPFSKSYYRLYLYWSTSICVRVLGSLLLPVYFIIFLIVCGHWYSMPWPIYIITARFKFSLCRYFSPHPVSVCLFRFSLIPPPTPISPPPPPPPHLSTTRAPLFSLETVVAPYRFVSFGKKAPKISDTICKISQIKR